MTESAVIVEKVNKKYENFIALNNVNLSVNRGEFFGLIGCNGAGKSTLVKILACLLRPDSGSVKILGYDVVKEHLEVKRRIGIVFEDLEVYELLTGHEFLSFICKIFGIADISYRTEKVIELLDLTDVKHKLIGEYSHGMKKKIMLAGAIIHDPEVLLLDEPFSGLDPIISETVKKILENLSDKGVTIIMSTHMLGVAEIMCNKIAILDRGSIVTQGSPELLIKEHQAKNLEDTFFKTVGHKNVETALPWR